MQCIGCPTKLGDNVAIDGFWLIISASPKSPLQTSCNQTAVNVQPFEILIGRFGCAQVTKQDQSVLKWTSIRQAQVVK